MRSSVWIDTDCGFDDLAAIAMVAADANWRILGLGIVAGNVPLDIAVRNAHRMNAFFKWGLPIHAGHQKPIIGKLVTAQHILGEDGLPTVNRTLPEDEADASSSGAINALAKALEVTSEPMTILALGPLTNIAVTLLARPDLIVQIREIVWMGGSASGGNYTSSAEFNAFVDPEAVAVVLETGVPVRMVGLDCCRQVSVNRTDAHKLRGLETDRARILADLLDGYVCIANPDGTRPMALFDAVAAAALLDDRAVAFIPAHVTIELAGKHTRGMTICEMRANKAFPNVMIARSAISTRIVDRFLTVLSHAAVMESEEQV